ncbi:MAG: PD-(D/E)XK nuclease family protein [Bacteroidales bacterium]
MSPNLFKYATSELSQDAFICWLIEWINHEKIDEYLFKTARHLLDKFFEISDKPKPSNYHSVIVKRQFKRIDIVILINNQYVIIIEDKTHTKNHSQQLQRYQESIKNLSGTNDLPNTPDIINIYFKTGNQCRYEEIFERDYYPFKRSDFLKILTTHIDKVNNAIFTDYYNYLNEIENKINSYRDLTVCEWDWWSIQGFLTELFDNYISKRKEFGSFDSWKYINNPRGGFWGLYWNWIPIIDESVYIYLQLDLHKEQNSPKTLNFKVGFENDSFNKEQKREIRDKIFDIAKGSFKYSEELNKPNLRLGQYMTFMIYSKNIFEDLDQTYDLKKVISLLIEAEQVLQVIAEKYSHIRVLD